MTATGDHGVGVQPHGGPGGSGQDGRYDWSCGLLPACARGPFFIDDHLHAPSLVWFSHRTGSTTSAILSAVATMDQIPVLEHHPHLYFSDGDIVLAAKVSSKFTSTPTAGSSAKYQLYCVHKPVLRHNSPSAQISSLMQRLESCMMTYRWRR